jgi:endonuclease G, mitochondrial
MTAAGTGLGFQAVMPTKRITKVGHTLSATLVIGAIAGCAADDSTDNSGDDGGRADTEIARDHLAMGQPSDGNPVDDVLIEKPQYVLSYNPFRNDPNWVSWIVSSSDYGATPRFEGKFFADPALPAQFYHVVHNDYTGSGFTRGHMVRSGERTDTAENNRSTFATTNILPQLEDLNGGPWRDLECYVERTAKQQDKHLFIVAGGIYPNGCGTALSPDGNAPDPSCPSIGRDHPIGVPETNFKIIVVLEPGQGPQDVTTTTPVIAVNMPNISGISRNRWTEFATTIDDIEKLTGYNFLSALDPSVQATLKSRMDIPADAPGPALEGPEGCPE